MPTGSAKLHVFVPTVTVTEFWAAKTITVTEISRSAFFMVLILCENESHHQQADRSELAREALMMLFLVLRSTLILNALDLGEWNAEVWGVESPTLFVLSFAFCLLPRASSLRSGRALVFEIWYRR